MSELTKAQWQSIAAELRAPFDPADIDFRPQGQPKPDKKTLVVGYIDARAVMDRLDEVVGPGDWSFDYTPLVIEKGEVQVAKGTLTIHSVGKSDVGSASNAEPSKGCVSDTLKRCAVLWGIGRYLYDLPLLFGDCDQYGKLTKQSLAELRGRLPRPHGAPMRPVGRQMQEAAEGDDRVETEATAQQQGRQRAQSSARIDAATHIVEADAQIALLKRIIRVLALSEAAQVDTWLDKNVRPSGAPKGPIDALKLKAGQSNITGMELDIANGALDRAEVR